MTDLEVELLLEKKKREKKKGRFSKAIVATVIILNILFTVAILYVFSQTGNEPATLIGCWFAFTTGELWMLSSIKKKKVKESENEY